MAGLLSKIGSNDGVDAGLQYKDLRDGSGEAAQDGSKVTIDWDGYTIGYYGRPFEGRNKACPCLLAALSWTECQCLCASCLNGAEHSRIR